MNTTLRALLIIALSLVALPLLWAVLMMSGSMMGGVGPGMMWGTQGPDIAWRWSGLGMMVPGFLLAGAIVAAVAWGIGASRGPDRPAEPSAREILDARYARGEITREEYQRMKDDIGT